MTIASFPSSEPRTWLLTMNADDAVQALKVAGGIASGAAGLKLFDWIMLRKKEKKQQSGEWQIKLVDAGENMREERAAEARALRVENMANMERAHRAEMEALTLRNENITLRSRLVRKDEQYKILCQQLWDAGHMPVTMKPGQDEWPSGPVPVEPDRKE